MASNTIFFKEHEIHRVARATTKWATARCTTLCISRCKNQEKQRLKKHDVARL